jgi:AcrR family transcriptional regulator
MGKAARIPARRMGSSGSVGAQAMLDGAEDILREEGYAALTSRRIAERIGVKQRLVYYYFHTMDDLIVETFRRLSVRELERHRRAASSERPVHALWNVSTHTADARMISEFMALANRIAALRDEVVHFIEESRAIQVEALQKALDRRRNASTIPAEGLAILANSVGLSLNREAQLGVSSGHAVITRVIQEFLSGLEEAKSLQPPSAKNLSKKKPTKNLRKRSTSA